MDIGERSGVYRITISRKDKLSMFYIGQSFDISERKAQHLRELRQGKSKNPAMQSAFNKYGENSFTFEILQKCEKNRDALSALEKKYLDAQIILTGSDSVYNVLRECTTSRLGTKATRETRLRMSAAQKGRKRSPAQLANFAKLGLSMAGKKLSPESIAKRTEKQKGIKRSEETKKRMSEAAKGRVISEVTRIRISESKKQSNWKPSQEHMEKLRLVNTGRVKTEEEKRAIAESLRGRKRPAEVHEKMWATRRINQSRTQSFPWPR